MELDPVDAVFTWVDGNDPSHYSKRMLFLGEKKLEHEAYASRSPTRFSDCGELYFSLALVRKHMPWIRNIFIVSDNQTPSWITETYARENRVVVIDHTVIFRDYEYILPTFSAVTIENFLWRIPNLSDSFISFNDDFFVVQPCRIEDFQSFGKTVLRGKYFWKPFLFRKFLKVARKLNLVSDPRGTIFRRQDTRSPGLKCFELAHTPRFVNKKDLEVFFDRHRETFLGQAYRFRNNEQLWIFSAYANLLLQEGRAIISDVDFDFSQPGDMTLLNEIKNKKIPKHVKFLSFNSLDELHPSVRRHFISYLEFVLSN